MCGRFAQTMEWARIFREMMLDADPDFDLPLLSHNVAPGTQIVIVASAGKKVAMITKWGLLTEWSVKSKYNLINIRDDTLLEKKTFSKLLKTNRCLIPVSAFYEWQKEGSGKKPYQIKMKDDRFFTLAGIWTSYTPSDDPAGKINTSAIITTIPNSVVAPIHERMPVIVPENKRDSWLSGENIALTEYLLPYPDDEMIAVPFAGNLSLSREKEDHKKEDHGKEDAEESLFS